MTECFWEPSLAEVLADPLVQVVMASDGVDPAELQASLTAIAGNIRRHPPIRLEPVGARENLCPRSRVKGNRLRSTAAKLL